MSTSGEQPPKPGDDLVHEIGQVLERFDRRCVQSYLEDEGTLLCHFRVNGSNRASPIERPLVGV